MQFHSYLERLPPDERGGVTNLLTLGCGRVSMAARRALRDEPCADVLAMLHAAVGPLREAGRRLADRPMPATNGDTWPQPARRHGVSWRAYMDGLGPAADAAIADALRAVVERARALGGSVRADAAVQDVRRDIDELVESLDALHRRIYAGA